MIKEIILNFINNNAVIIILYLLIIIINKILVAKLTYLFNKYVDTEFSGTEHSNIKDAIKNNSDDTGFYICMYMPIFHIVPLVVLSCIFTLDKRHLDCLMKKVVCKLKEEYM